eukprot:scaffold4600_cov74-Phaeocystis_antarctica.AAC.7
MVVRHTAHVQARLERCGLSSKPVHEEAWELNSRSIVSCVEVSEPALSQVLTASPPRAAPRSSPEATGLRKQRTPSARNAVQRTAHCAKRKGSHPRAPHQAAGAPSRDTRSTGKPRPQEARESARLAQAMPAACPARRRLRCKRRRATPRPALGTTSGGRADNGMWQLVLLAGLLGPSLRTQRPECNDHLRRCTRSDPVWTAAQSSAGGTHPG